MKSHYGRSFDDKEFDFVAARVVLVLEELTGVRLPPDDDIRTLPDFAKIEPAFIQHVREMTVAPVDHNLLGEYATPRRLAGYVRDNPRLRHRNVVTTLKSGKGLPVFWIHSLSGHIIHYYATALFMETERPLVAVESPMLHDPGYRSITIEQMTKDYVEIIRRIDRTGPYTIVGYSFGARLVCTIAEELQKAGQVVDGICLIDSSGFRRSPSSLDAPETLAARIATTYLPLKLRAFPVSGRDSDLLYETYYGNALAAIRHEFRPIDCRSLVVYTREAIEADLTEAYWRSMLGNGCTFCLLEGGHLDIFFPPKVQIISYALDAFLTAVGNP